MQPEAHAYLAQARLQQVEGEHAAREKPEGERKPSEWGRQPLFGVEVW